MKRKQQEPAPPTRKSARIRAELEVAAATATTATTAVVPAQAAAPQTKPKPAPRKKVAPKTQELSKSAPSNRRSTRFQSVAPAVVPPPTTEPALANSLPTVVEAGEAQHSIPAPPPPPVKEEPEDSVAHVHEVAAANETPVLVPAAARRRKAAAEEEEAPTNTRAGKRARTTTTPATSTKSTTASKVKPKVPTASKGKGKAKAAPTPESDGSGGARLKRSWFKNKTKLTIPDELVNQAAPQEAPPRCKVCKSLDIEAQRANGRAKHNYICEECDTRRSGSSNSNASVVDAMFAAAPSGSRSSSKSLPLPELPILEQAQESAERTTSLPERYPSPIVEEVDDDEANPEVDEVDYQLPRTPLRATSRRSERIRVRDTVSPPPQRSQPRWSFTSAQVPGVNDLASFSSTRPGQAVAGPPQPRAMVLYHHQAAAQAPPLIAHRNSPSPLPAEWRSFVPPEGSMPSPSLPPPSPDTPPPADIMPWHLATSERRQWYRVRRLRFWQHIMGHLREEERNIEEIIAEEGRRITHEVPKNAPIPEGLGGVLGMSVMNTPPRAEPGRFYARMGGEQRRRIAHLRYRDHDSQRAMGMIGVIEEARMELEEETTWVDLVTLAALPVWMWQGPPPDAPTYRLPDEDFSDYEGGGRDEEDDGDGEDEDEDEDGDDQPPHGGDAASVTYGYANSYGDASDTDFRRHHHDPVTESVYNAARAQAAQANHLFQPRYWNAGGSQHHGHRQAEAQVQQQAALGRPFREPSHSHPRPLPHQAPAPPMAPLAAPPPAPRIPPRLLQPVPGYSHHREHRLDAVHASSTAAANASNSATRAGRGTRRGAPTSPTERDTPTPPANSTHSVRSPRHYRPDSPVWQPDSPPRDWRSSRRSRVGSRSPASPTFSPARHFNLYSPDADFPYVVSSTGTYVHGVRVRG